MSDRPCPYDVGAVCEGDADECRNYCIRQQQESASSSVTQGSTESIVVSGVVGEIIDCYEREFYVFSNFSSFQLRWKGRVFPTSEHAYHWERFAQAQSGPNAHEIATEVHAAASAHEAFKLAQSNKHLQVENWDDVKVAVMEQILRCKVEQHPYVKKKLIESYPRQIVECSWRDDFWGWGPNKDGLNMLGRTWMKIREDYVACEQFAAQASGGMVAEEPTPSLTPFMSVIGEGKELYLRIGRCEFIYPNGADRNEALYGLVDRMDGDIIIRLNPDAYVDNEHIRRMLGSLFARTSLDSSPALSVEEERKAFEAWWKSTDRTTLVRSRIDNANYELQCGQEGWEAWLACAEDKGRYEEVRCHTCHGRPKDYLKYFKRPCLSCNGHGATFLKLSTPANWRGGA